MNDEVDLYQGREHSKIKHEFLKEYLTEASFKVLQSQTAKGTFTYVDGFAGPWSVADEDQCSDSSFDYAVRVLLDTRAALRKTGRPVQLRFLLCERDAERFKKLDAYAAGKSGIDIRVFEGNFEDNLDKIQAASTGFVFTFVDPKGWNLRSVEIAKFLATVGGDFLLNFMEHPISRHNGYAGVEKSFARFLADDDWLAKISNLPGAAPREKQILGLLKSRLKDLGAANYVPDFPILKPDRERIQMRLVLGTNHPTGVEVFRTVESRIASLQLETRRKLSDPQPNQPFLFDTDAHNAMDFDGREVGGARNRADAKTLAIDLIKQLNLPTPFLPLAARIMEEVPVRVTHVKDILVDLKREGKASFELIARAKKPNETTMISKPAV